MVISTPVKLTEAPFMRSKPSFVALIAFTSLAAASAARADDDDPAKGKFTLEQATYGATQVGLC